MNTRAGLLVSLLALAVTAACNGDDDAAETSTVASTDPPATLTASSAPTTPATDPPTTPPTTVASTTTVAAADALQVVKDQISADFLRAEQAREDLVRNPSLEGLESRVANIAVAGSSGYDSLLAFVQGMVERGERVVPGDPDYSQIVVEQVEVTDTAATTAVLTVCEVTNEARVGPDGIPLDGSGVLGAFRLRQLIQLTDVGWLPGDQPEALSIDSGSTTCAPV